MHDILLGETVTRKMPGYLALGDMRKDELDPIIRAAHKAYLDDPTVDGDGVKTPYVAFRNQRLAEMHILLSDEEKAEVARHGLKMTSNPAIEPPRAAGSSDPDVEEIDKVTFQQER